MYINVAPLLTGLMECFTALIFYQSIDFGEPKFPVSLFHNGMSFKFNNCTFPDEEVERTDTSWVYKWTCSAVLRNFQVKGTRCIGIMSIYPPRASGFGEKEIYTLLNYYWSRAEPQTIKFKDSTEEESKYLRPLYPLTLVIQSLVGEVDSLRSGHVWKEVIKREWEPFIWTPVVLISVSKESTANESFTANIGFSFYKLIPVLLGEMKISFESGLNYTQLNQEMEHFRRNQLKVKFNLEEYGMRGKHQGELDFNTLIELIQSTFNESMKLTQRGLESANVSPKWDYWRRTINIDVRRDEDTLIHDIDAKYFLISEKRIVGVTCSGMSPISSLGHLVSPYEKYCWIWLSLLILSISALFFIPTKYRELAIQFPSILIIILLENSYTIKDKFQLPPVRLVIGLFLLMGIILSNGYKGVVTTSTVQPLKRQGLDSFQSALLLNNFKHLTTFSRPRMRDRVMTNLRAFCCQTEEGLSHKLNPALYVLQMKEKEEEEDEDEEEEEAEDEDWEEEKEEKEDDDEEEEKEEEEDEDKEEEHVQELVECSDILSYADRLELIITFFEKFDFETKMLYLAEFGRIGNLNGIVPLGNANLTHRLALKLVQNTQTHECNQASKDEDFFSCNGSLSLVDAVDFNLGQYKAMDKFNHSRKSINPVYAIENTNGLFQPHYTKFSVYPLCMARRMLSHVMSVFDELGFTDRMRKDELHFKKRSLISEWRRKFGRLVDQTHLPVRMTLSTNIYYTFIIYLYCLSGAFSVLIIEIFRMKKSQLTLYWNKILLWAKGIVSNYGMTK